MRSSCSQVFEFEVLPQNQFCFFPSEEAEQQTGESINPFEDSQYTIWQKLQ
jgi:hypothetical protein